MKRKQIITILCIIMLLALTGCTRELAEKLLGKEESSSEVVQPTTEQGSIEELNEPSTGISVNLNNASMDLSGEPSTTSEPAQDSTTGMQTETITDEYFTAVIPKGWTYTVSTYMDFAFYAYDPLNKDYGYFYLYGCGPFMKSEEGKKYFTDSHFTTAPVLSNPTVDNLYLGWTEFLTYANSFGYYDGYPLMNDIVVMGREEFTSPLSVSAVDEANVTLSFISERGTQSKGMFGASIVPEATYYVGNVDTGFYYAYNMCGFFAPEEQYDNYAETLSGCLSAIEVTEAWKDKYQEDIKQ